jgi:hypothetical protein
MERIGSRSRTDGKMDEWTNGQITRSQVSGPLQCIKNLSLSLNPLAFAHHPSPPINSRPWCAARAVSPARFGPLRGQQDSHIQLHHAPPPEAMHVPRAHRDSDGDGSDDDDDDGMCAMYHVP